MTGIALLVLCLVWLALVMMAAIFAANRFSNSAMQWGVGLIVFIAITPLPLLDEIVGQHQFDALCQIGTVLTVDQQRIKGRRIKLTFEPSNAPVSELAVPTTFTRVMFRDALSGEVFGSYGRYVAKGGWLVRTLGLSEADSPLWMSRSQCSPEEGSKQMATRYGFEIVRSPPGGRDSSIARSVAVLTHERSQ